MNLDPAMIAQALVIAALIGIATDHFKIRRELGATELSLQKMRTFVAEQYVAKPEIAKIIEEVANLRHTLDEAVKLLYEIKGSQSNQNRG